MRILIADDHPAFRDALELYVVRAMPQATLLFAASLEELSALPSSPAVDLVLLDWHLPSGEGGDGLDHLAARGITAPVIVLSGDTDERAALRALTQGARAFLPKTLPRDAIVAAIQLVLAGGSSVPAEIALRMAMNGPLRAAVDDGPPLTVRESEVLRQLATGATNKEIGRLLGLQEVTVKLHTRRILRKLGAKNRTDAVVKARDSGVLSESA